MDLTTREKNCLKKKYIENEMQLRRWTPIRYIDNTTETEPMKHFQENMQSLLENCFPAKRRRFRNVLENSFF